MVQILISLFAGLLEKRIEQQMLWPIGRRGSSGRIDSGSKFQLVKDYEHAAHLALYKSSIFVFA